MRRKAPEGLPDGRNMGWRFLVAAARNQLLVGSVATVLIFALGMTAWYVQQYQFRDRALRNVGLSIKMCNAAADALDRRTHGGIPSAEDPVQVYLLSYLERCRLP